MDIRKLNEDLTKLLTEASGRYVTQQDVEDGLATEDEYLDSFEYIYSQKLNGNLSEYRKYLAELQVEGDLRDYADYCKEHGLDAGFENDLDNKDAEPSEDEDYEYIYSSLVNGNITQYKKMLKRLQSKGQLKKYKAYCNELGVDSEIDKYLA